ncbi:PIN domain-like protein [Hesseltinella vesiculosa]|uniref:PIN domain-like protein n=1 Tax=Hesseltinella vesiculosa TaxID=101127 RepID=A0A1X2GNN3_9FUNG|nr:PIN domain-like protein [Hesseltinella vesiculosa]
MGISGFLPLLKPIEQKVHIKEYAGKKVAIDGNVWLHRGAFACARELALGQETNVYIQYFLRHIKMLLHFNVEPVVVFDGAALPIKQVTHAARQKKRQAALEDGFAALRMGKTQLANESFQRSIHITPQMINKVKKALEQTHVKYIQAPFEADAQLTYLCRQGKVAAVVTEDSDLLVFGCPTVLLKMDGQGNATQILHDDLTKVKDDFIDFTKWDSAKIRHMCILSGCDYLPSLPGVGLRYAYNLLHTSRSLDKVFTVLQVRGKMKRCMNYKSEFYRANQAFLYQYVYDPDREQMLRLTDPTNDKDQPLDLSFLGHLSKTNDTLDAKPIRPTVSTHLATLPSSTTSPSSPLPIPPPTAQKRKRGLCAIDPNRPSLPNTFLPNTKKPQRPTTSLLDKLCSGKENIPVSLCLLFMLLSHAHSFVAMVNSPP